MEVCALQSVDKKEIVKVWFQEVFTEGNTDVLKEIASEDMVTHSQGNDKGYVGIKHFKNWLSWYCTSFIEREWSIHDTIEEGDKIARYIGHSIYKDGLLDITGYPTLTISGLKKQESLYFESKMVRLLNNGVK